jgi:hypothetical protein
VPCLFQPIVRHRSPLKTALSLIGFECKAQRQMTRSKSSSAMGRRSVRSLDGSGGIFDDFLSFSFQIFQRRLVEWTRKKE